MARVSGQHPLRSANLDIDILTYGDQVRVFCAVEYPVPKYW